MNKLLLIDGNSLVYRAYYGSAYSRQGILKTSTGVPVNAVLTFNRMLNKIIDEQSPSHILIAFDAGKKTRRHEKLPSYKSGRSETPIELIKQFPIVEEMLNKLNIKTFKVKGIEADDIIGTMAKKENDANSVIVSSDKDLYQLVSKNVIISVPQNGALPNKEINISNFEDIMGVSPDQIPDYKGLVGDSSDNLPGVAGIGPKGAVKLLGDFKTLEGIYNSIDSITGKTKEKLENSRENAFLTKELATLDFKVSVPYKMSDLKFSKSASNELFSFLKKYELNSLIRYYEKFNKQDDANYDKFVL